MAKFFYKPPVETTFYLLASVIGTVPFRLQAYLLPLSNAARMVCEIIVVPGRGQISARVNGAKNEGADLVTKLKGLA